VIDVSARVNPDGTIIEWTLDNYNSGPAAIRPTYVIVNQRVAYHPSDSPLRQGSYRGLAATANNIAREMHVDELARLVEMDPLTFLLFNLETDGCKRRSRRLRMGSGGGRSRRAAAASGSRVGSTRAGTSPRAPRWRRTARRAR
jgi:isoquinoline 1-oxidoreductase